jgi:intergrase/recombinase
MSSVNEPKVAKSPRKDARENIEKKLDLLLVDLKKEIGDTKFKNRIRKAAKILSKGLAKAKDKGITVKTKAEKPAKTVKTKKKATTKVAAKPAQ